MKLWITGGTGFLGTALTRAAKARGIDTLSTGRDVNLNGDNGFDPSEQILRFLDRHKPTHIIHAAALVGGIGANRARPADFFYENAQMGINLMDAALRYDVEKLVTIGTVCSYPAETPVPFREDDLWNGYPEPTNAPYGLAKKMLLVMGQAYRQQYGFNSVHVLPTNLYGPGDHFGEGAHVIPNLIEKFAAAKLTKSDVTLWGDGTPSRDFLYVDDAAEGIMRVLESYDSPEPLNLGSGVEVQIRDLAAIIADKMGFTGNIVWDTSYPNGQMRRQLDSTRAEKALGWKATTSFEDGLAKMIEWYRESVR
jgi:GDP-L-fucose synthase